MKIKLSVLKKYKDYLLGSVLDYLIKKAVIKESPIHWYFGLSYANYLVLPRSVLQSMPIKWQEDFVKLLE